MVKKDPQTTEDKIIHALLVGTHPKAANFQGKHVMAVGKQIVPIEEVPPPNSLFTLCLLSSLSSTLLNPNQFEGIIKVHFLQNFYDSPKFFI